MSVLQDNMLQSFGLNSKKKALSVGGQTYTYQDVLDCASSILQEISTCGQIGIYGDRSFTSYVGVALSLFAGKAFVPLNPAFPIKQNIQMLKLSGTRTVLFDAQSAQQICAFAESYDEPLLFLVFQSNKSHFDKMDVVKEALENSPHSVRFISKNVGGGVDVDCVRDHSTLYILFTSGTTGTPKGVPISHGNVDAYLSGVSSILDLNSEDRFSQTFDLTFDLSMHDIFLTWSVGGCLCVPSRLELIAPQKYIEREKITVWFSVPSMAALMQKMKLLEPNSYTKLKYSIFCGEALSVSLARSFQNAAPNSTVINFYGPTEATIAFTYYIYDVNKRTDYVNGIVPIGRPFGHNLTSVRDENLDILSDGNSGELCLAGSQLTSGYLDNQAQNKSRFFIDPDNGQRWYRTGDRVYYDLEEGYIYLGRTDHQVKIMGYRVELAEIENTLRQVAQSEHVAAVPWPVEDGVAKALVGFVVAPVCDEKTIKLFCKNALAYYKQPSEIIVLDRMPLNSNGKIDRNALCAYLIERV